MRSRPSSPLPAPGALLAAAWLLAGAASSAAAAAQVQVQITLEPQVVALDETVTLAIEARGSGLASLSFMPSYTLENLEPVGGPSQMEDLNYINGSVSRSFRYLLRLRPVGTGPARVRNVGLSLRGHSVRLPDREVQVQEAGSVRPGAGAGPGGGGPGGAAGLGGAGNGAAGGTAGAGGVGGVGGAGAVGGAPGAGPGGGGPPRMPTPEELLQQLFGGRSPFADAQRDSGPPAFLRAEVQPPRPLVGEQAIYTVYLYTRQDVAAINATDMPSFRGFWVRDLPQPERLIPEPVQIGNQRYVRVPMIRKALFGLRPGRHPLEVAGCDVQLEAVRRSFFGPPPMGAEELHLQTPVLNVDVQPLPPAPPGFAGLVGQVSLSASLKPYSLRLGDGATLTVTLAGAGNLSGVAAPRLDVPSGLTVYPPQQQSEEQLGGGVTVQGRRTWIYVVVPQRPGQFVLRPQAVSYFDPVHRQYDLAQSPPLPLTALAAAPPPQAAHGAPGAKGAPNARGALAAGAAVGTAAREPGGPLQRVGAILSSWRGRWPRLFPWLALAAAAVLTILLTSLAKLGVESRRKRRGRAPAGSGSGLGATGLGATGAAAAGATPRAPGAVPGPAPDPAAAAQPAAIEQTLRQAAREERPRQAAALIEQGWRDYLAGRWRLPATLPPARWGAALAELAVAPEVSDAMIHLVEDIHYLRYAPQLSATASVRDDLLTRSRQLLRRLR